MIGDISCPIINAIFYISTRTGQKWTIPGIECDVMAHVMLVATGRWSWGWWYHCAGWLRLVFSSLLLHVILNQNPIMNSTNLFTGEWRRDKEMWWQLETLIEASDAWAPQKWLNQVFLSTLFAKTRRLHYVEKGTSAHSLVQSYSNFNKLYLFLFLKLFTFETASS
jgi:hypothetical protein